MKELIYPSTYHAMKAGPCRVGVCKHDGKCWLCKEYGTLRRYAARDVDRIHELRELVKEMAECIFNNPCTGCSSYSCAECTHRREMDSLVARAQEEWKNENFEM